MDTAALTAENQLVREQVGVLVGRLEALSLELARLKRQRIGPKSERRTPEDPVQGHLFAAAASWKGQASLQSPLRSPRPWSPRTGDAS